MRLKVFILDGDWATTDEGSIARYLAYRLKEATHSSGSQEEAPSRSVSPRSAETGQRPDEAFPVPDIWLQLKRELDSQLIDVEATEDTKVEALIEAIQKKRGVGQGIFQIFSARSLISTRLYESPAERLLRDDASLGEEGLEDGDLVTLRIKRDSGIGYMLLPGPDPEFIFNSISSRDGRPPIPGDYLWGAFLYTDEDADLASYVRRYFLELNALTGSILRLFVVEKPADWREAKKYWRQHLDADTFNVLANLRWLFYKPYDRRRAYEIAERMGVRPDQLPCVALIYGDPPQNDLLAFPVPATPTPTYFRSLFSHIYDTIGDSPGPGLDLEQGRHYGFERASGRTAEYDTLMEPADADSATGSRAVAWQALRARYDQIVEAVTPVSTAGAEVKNFSFYGHTVFVNRPGEGTVIHTGHDGDGGAGSE
jgi:hypothetical protein